MVESLHNSMIPFPYRIQRFFKETHDTFTFELQPIHGNPILSYRPGQFNMLYVFGVGEVPISISGNPHSNEFILHTTRVVGNVTRLMRKLKPGEMIGVRGPFGSYWPVDEAQDKDVVIAAGGIGLAPLRPVIYHLLHQREKYNRIILLYGTRTPQDILYNKELKQWRSKLDLEIYVTVDRATESWRGNVGVVTSLISRAPFDPKNTLAFVCGPEIMMNVTVRTLKERGLTSQQIYISMERNMKCAIGFCGHCQYGPYFICKDGPVFRFDKVEKIFRIPEI